MIPQCILPWVWLDMEPNGDVRPCCANTNILGNINTESLEEIWNGKKMKEFRLSLLENKLPNSCFACIKSEELGFESYRETYNELFKTTFDEVAENTNEDGSLKTIKFKGFNFKVSNKCNYKCRMCDPEISSSFGGKIIGHSKKLNFEKFVESNIEYFESIGFSGGESLIMDEHYWLLQKLIDMGKTDIHLQYCTNMSTLKYKSHNVLEYWNKWNPEKLFVAASIDEMGNRAEYLRKGSQWPVVEKNLKILAQQSFNVQVNVVVSCYNVFRLPELVQYLTDIGYINPKKFLDEKYKYNIILFSFIDNAISDSNRSVWILPENYKKKVKQKLISFVDDYNFKYKTDIRPIFNPILLYLNKKSDKQLVHNFLKENTKMDIDRKENLFKVFPEFVEILDEWKSSGLV